MDEAVKRAARDLVAGDRIAAGFLPFKVASDVVFVYPYTNSGRDWILVVHRYDDGDPDVDFFLADKPIPLERLAEPAGREDVAPVAVPDSITGQAVGRAAEQVRP